jgi:hypothetical protein
MRRHSVSVASVTLLRNVGLHAAIFFRMYLLMIR